MQLSASPSLARQRLRAPTLVFGLVILSSAPVFAWTTVSPIPDLQDANSMSRFIGVGDDVLVIPEAEGGSLFQLAFDGLEWTPVAQHNVLDWLGYQRIHTPLVFPIGDEVLIFDSSPVYEGFRAPEATVLKRIDGLLAPVQTVSLASKLTDPDIYSLYWNNIVPLDDLLVFRNQVNFLGYGARLWGHTFLKTSGGWIAGGDKEFPTGYWWPLYSERAEDGVHLIHMQMTSAYGALPQEFAIIDSLIEEASWTETGRSTFQFTEQWNGVYQGLRALLSPDRLSMLVFAVDITDNPVNPMEFVRSESGWTYVGRLADSGVDVDELYLVQLADGYALVRRGAINLSYGDQILQQYHLLKYSDGKWTLQGDLPSHRPLVGYIDSEIFYSIGEEWLTIFDRRPYWPSTWGARSYSTSDFSPRLVKWFPDSVTIDASTEWIPAFGFIEPLLSNSPSGMWARHREMGWVYICGRDSSSFWFHGRSLGWTWFSNLLFDEGQPAWLFSWTHNDFIWCLHNQQEPRLFHSSRYGEWLSSTQAPDIDQQVVEDVIAAISAEVADTGVTIEVDYESRSGSFSYTDMVDGKTVTIRMLAYWQYTAGTDYSCQARFEIDMSSLEITVDGETTMISSYDLWTEAELLVPARLIIDYIFLDPDSGVAIEKTQFNDFSWSEPVRERF